MGSLTGGSGWKERYSRQIRFAPIGVEGQRSLDFSSALIVGCGALGASLAQHMARAGVGRIVIADRDYVEPSNLQRQVLFDEADAEQALPKAAAAAEKLQRINSAIRIDAHVSDVSRHNVEKFADGVQLILDGTDNAATRLLLSDAAFRQGIPFLYGGVVGAQGMSAVLVPGETACLRCLIGGEASALEGDSCDSVGVLAAAVEWVASLQAIEAVKWLTGNREAVRGTWLSADLWDYRVRESRLPGGTPSCPHCGVAAEVERRGIGGGKTYGSGPAMEPAATVLCGRDSVQVTLGVELDMPLLRESLQRRGCRLQANKYLVKAYLPQGERLVLFPDGRVLVQGTSDVAGAEDLCRHYVTEYSIGGMKR
ncbi:ThiF family adenylyltransferase [Paenibacillus sp. J5C_2022]|uniref:ThiF family adenylyltransferase n=1 Tax=Paenibacillus sp. J5C2022 TaxID=2977129 RepID=UPI0021D24250|nr:ThiF family adenylyltransferase [Paenibacillus sp. J5C2022]MCU6710413.1 ThiF family adenylyltransferase [Paenibacillus sp. J5C2022]